MLLFFAKLMELSALRSPLRLSRLHRALPLLTAATPCLGIIVVAGPKLVATVAVGIAVRMRRRVHHHLGGVLALVVQWMAWCTQFPGESGPSFSCDLSAYLCVVLFRKCKYILCSFVAFSGVVEKMGIFFRGTCGRLTPWKHCWCDFCRGCTPREYARYREGPMLLSLRKVRLPRLCFTVV